MTNEQKKQIRDALVRYCNKYTSQALAAESLSAISTTTISQVKNNNWELLSDRMWYNIARQVGFYCGEWQAADTSAYLLLRILTGDAQHYNMTYGVCIGEGMGKTFASGRYARENENTFYVACEEQYNRRSFIINLLRAAGLTTGGTVPEMMQRFACFVTGSEEPVLIFDDAELLKDRVLHLIVLLANELAGKCGIVILGKEKLRNRIIEGARLKKPGFDEIYKSIGRRFITLSNPGANDVEAVCIANGLFDEEIIRHIKEESNGNLHHVTQMIIRNSTMNRAA